MKMSKILALCALGLCYQTSNAAVLLVDNTTNQLLGANDVTVNGSSYNVRFAEGTCASAFTGCANFTFTTGTDALSASQALLDQVFLDVTDGSFDAIPSLTAGISDPGLGFALTPYALANGIEAAFARNGAEPPPNQFFADGVGIPAAPYSLSLDLTDVSTASAFGNRATWAVWTSNNDTTPLPEPSVIASLLAGVIAMAALRRKHSRLTKKRSI